MTRPIRTRTVIGTRPAEAPAQWEIYNAPRPIFGDVQWQGEFRSGVFYAAIDPTDTTERAVWQRQQNRQNDAVVLTYIEEEEAFQAGRQRMLERYGDAHSADSLEVVDDPRNRTWVINSYLDFLNFGEN